MKLIKPGKLINVGILPRDIKILIIRTFFI